MLIEVAIVIYHVPLSVMWFYSKLLSSYHLMIARLLMWIEVNSVSHTTPIMWWEKKDAH